jgi:hypothetical protein
VTLSGLSGLVCQGDGSKALNLTAVAATGIVEDKAKQLAARLIRGFPDHDFVCFKAEDADSASFKLIVYLEKVWLPLLRYSNASTIIGYTLRCSSRRYTLCCFRPPVPEPLHRRPWTPRAASGRPSKRLSNRPMWFA